MKTLVLGDIHGRTIWKDIIDSENPDKIIFLGDYVSTHDKISSSQQIDNLENILTYKEDNLDKVILLRGNHCDQHLGYYWAECSGLDRKVLNYMSEKSFKERFLSLTQWVYVDKELRTVFSHAGISEVWLSNLFIEKGIESIDDINKIEPCELFGFLPNKLSDYYGTSVTQPLTWIRPQTLVKCNIEGYTQVVGHTPFKNIINIKGDNNEDIWLCDCLDNNQYLVIEDKVFIPKTFNYGN